MLVMVSHTLHEEMKQKKGDSYTSSHRFPIGLIDCPGKSAHLLLLLPYGA